MSNKVISALGGKISILVLFYINATYIFHFFFFFATCRHNPHLFKQTMVKETVLSFSVLDSAVYFFGVKYALLRKNSFLFSVSEMNRSLNNDIGEAGWLSL